MANYDLAIIGGGPGGLAAAAFVRTTGLKYALITPDLGGKVNYGFSLRDRPAQDTVWGSELVRQFEKTMQEFPDHHIKQEVAAVEREESGLFRITLVESQGVEHTVRAKSLIITTGARQQRLFVPGEKEFWGRGVSFSALSHAPFFEGRNVLVVGSGSRMLVAALQLATLANKVYLVPTMAFDGNDPRVQSLHKQPNVESLEGWHVESILGDEFVTHAMLSKGYDQKKLEVEGVFVQLGLLPNTDFLNKVAPLDEESGCIAVNQRCETSVPGLFAAGDVTNIFSEQVPIAIGEGMKAAISAWEYLVTAQNKSLQPEKWTDLSL